MSASFEFVVGDIVDQHVDAQLASITSAGQLAVAAAVRRRWQTRSVLIEDWRDHLVVRPAPEDPVAAARGSFKGRFRHSTEEMRQLAREDERHAEERKYGREQ